MGIRRKSRELALRVLYTFEVGKTGFSKAWEIVGDEYGGRENEFAEKLVSGTVKNIDLIDSIIEKHAKNWSPERIAAVDKSIMRMALYEIYFEESIPKVVSINEAVELAKKYSTGSSHRFVNGILDAASLQQEEVKPDKVNE